MVGVHLTKFFWPGQFGYFIGTSSTFACPKSGTVKVTAFYFYLSLCRPLQFPPLWFFVARKLFVELNGMASFPLKKPQSTLTSSSLQNCMLIHWTEVKRLQPHKDQDERGKKVVISRLTMVKLNIFEIFSFYSSQTCLLFAVILNNLALMSSKMRFTDWKPRRSTKIGKNFITFQHSVTWKFIILIICTANHILGANAIGKNCECAQRWNVHW